MRGFLSVEKKNFPQSCGFVYLPLQGNPQLFPIVYFFSVFFTAHRKDFTFFWKEFFILWCIILIPIESVYKWDMYASFKLGQSCFQSHRSPGHHPVYVCMCLCDCVCKRERERMGEERERRIFCCTPVNSALHGWPLFELLFCVPSF